MKYAANGEPCLDFDKLMEESAKCGIRPRQFWRCTLRELTIACMGYIKRLEDQRRLVAWHASLQLQIWSKEPITAAQLLGEQKPAPSYVDQESLRAAMREKQRRANGEDI